VRRLVDRDEDHNDVGMLGVESGGRLEPVHSRHADVEQNEVGTHLFDERQSMLARRSVAEHVEPGRNGDYLAGDLPEYELVVHDDHANRERTPS
jgi:hypothetical protein